MTLTSPRICTVALELSRSRGMIGVLPPRAVKVSIQAVVGGDTARLMDHLNKIDRRLRDQYGEAVDVKVCLESGYDGFWLARFLRDRGVDVFVLDASSFLISRRGRRTNKPAPHAACRDRLVLDATPAIERVRRMVPFQVR
jgi:transposase